MKISEIMSTDVRLVGPDQPIRDAAAIMAEIDVGSVPVATSERLVGMITDRDIAIRAVGGDQGPSTPIKEVMTEGVKYCFDDEEVESVVENMGDIQLRRLPVVDRNKRLVGIVSLADIATKTNPSEAAVALSGISEPNKKD